MSDVETPEAPFGADSHAPLPDDAMPEGFPIKGNADSMKFHQPGGRWYDSTVAEVWFNTAEAATAAGFTEAGTSTPPPDASASTPDASAPAEEAPAEAPAAAAAASAPAASTSDAGPAGSSDSEGRENPRKVREGIVVSTGMNKTAVVESIDRVRHRRYAKTVQRSTKLFAHDENNDANVGDLVQIQETRPLSKKKRWRLVEVIERAR